MKLYRLLPLVFILALACAANTAFAQTDDVSGRAHVFEFLNVTPTPRAAALGNSYVAMKNDPNAIFSNPGALSTIEPDTLNERDQHLEFGFTKHVLDINEGFLSYAQPIPEAWGFSGTLATGVQYIDYGTFNGFDGAGQSTGTFNSREFAISLAYSGIEKHHIHYGLGVKFINSNLVSGSSVEDFSATGIAADLGVFYEYQPALMTFGISAINLGTQLKTYAGVKEDLPADVEIGISKRLEKLPLTLHLAFRNLTRDREGRGIFYALNDFSVGGEFVLGKVVRLRFGYENQKRRDLTLPQGAGLAGFSAGLGFVIKQYQFDVAYNNQGYAFTPLVRFGAGVAF